ncbi:MAG: TerD family protein [Oscillospiraceae bacterium]|nr:TerD family protein [Oscillospiraceae bacterium]
MENIQNLIDSGSGHIMLPSGEFKGPFIIKHPCIVEGRNTTLWCSEDSVVIIRSNGVTLKNLRIEMVNPRQGETFSVDAAGYGAKLDSTEVSGQTNGLGCEDSIIEMTRQYRLGGFKANESNSYYISVFSPDKAELVTNMHDLTFEPTVLSGGANKIKVTVSALPDKTFLYGDVLIKSNVIRRFYISGYSSADSPVCTQKVLPQEKPGSYDESKLVQVFTVQQPVNNSSVQRQTPIKRAAAPETRSINVPSRLLNRGERVSLEGLSDNVMTVKMGFKSLLKNMDIDPYVFMLDSKGITSCDDDFIYFGNMQSDCGSIVVNQDKSIDVLLSNVPSHIMKVTFAYSIYLPGPNDNFSKIIDPFVSITQSGREIFRFEASGLFSETTITFFEFYRYQSKWKINAVGYGYRDGLKRLCASYGLIVS